MNFDETTDVYEEIEDYEDFMDEDEAELLRLEEYMASLDVKYSDEEVDCVFDEAYDIHEYLCTILDKFDFIEKELSKFYTDSDILNDAISMFVMLNEKYESVLHYSIDIFPEEFGEYYEKKLYPLILEYKKISETIPLIKNVLTDLDEFIKSI